MVAPDQRGEHQGGVTARDLKKKIEREAKPLESVL